MKGRKQGCWRREKPDMRFEHWLHTIPLRLRSLFRRPEVEQELDEELRYHIQRQIDEYVDIGLTPEDARRRALRAIGGVEQRKEQCRTMRRVNIIENLIQDIKYGFRVLKKNPGFAAAAILTLALGVGANVAVFAVVEAVLLRPFPYLEADKLVIVKHRDKRTGITKEFVAVGDSVDLTARQGSFEGFSSYGSFQATVYGAAEPYRILGLEAGPGLLETLKVRPTLGRDLRPEDSRPGAAPVMLMGYQMWKDHFGSDPSIVGRGVKIDQVERQVVGVTPPDFHFPPNAKTEAVLPQTVPTQAPAERKSGWTFMVGRIKSGLSIKEVTANLATVSAQMEQEHPQSNQATEYFAESMRDALVGSSKSALMLLLAAVAVVLLIACTNVANLFLARSLARRHEMAVRMALGAGRGRLTAQMLTESLVLTIIAAIIGVFVAYWGARALVALVPKTVDVPGLSDIRINYVVLAFALVISIGTALIVGFISTLTLRSEKALGALGAPTRMSVSATARRMTSALVVAEVALAIVLLIGAGLILQSFARLLSADPGFRIENVVTMQIALPADRYRSTAACQAFYQRAFPAIRAIGDVKETGVGVVVPLTGNNWSVPFERPDQPVPDGERPPEVGWQAASGGFFKTLEIPLVAGRYFDEHDLPGGKPVVIVSEAIQKRFFPNESAVGRQFKAGNQNMEIVGVVGNIRRAGLRDDPRADLYFSAESSPSRVINLFVRRNQIRCALWLR